MRRTDFARVEAIGRTLPDVDVTTTYGKPALKVGGRMFACIPAHKSAEPHSLVVMMELADRDLLLDEAPDVYYVKEHYVDYPCILVRLSRVSDAALKDLVTGAHRFVSSRARKPGRARKSPRPAKGEVD